MGEIADTVINGEGCEMCLMPLKGAPLGYPATCTECGGDVQQDLSGAPAHAGEGFDDEDSPYDKDNPTNPQDGDPDGKRYTGGD